MFPEVCVAGSAWAGRLVLAWVCGNRVGSERRFGHWGGGEGVGEGFGTVRFRGITAGHGWSVLRFGVLRICGVLRGRGSDFGYPLYIDDAVGFSCLVAPLVFSPLLFYHALPSF